MAPLAVVSAAFIAVQQQQKGGTIRKNNLSNNNYYSRGIAIRRYVDIPTLPHRRKHILYTTDDDIQSPNSHENDANLDNETKNVAKPLSPLAMAAADWLEEEEDELAMYWDRYDVAKKSSTSGSSTAQPQSIPPSEPSGSLDDTINTATSTTEELLDRYYESRNIDRGLERSHATQIKQAIEKLQKPPRQPRQYNSSHLYDNIYNILPNWVGIPTTLN